MIGIDYDTSIEFFRVPTDPLDLAEYVVQSPLWPAENDTIDLHQFAPCPLGACGWALQSAQEFFFGFLTRRLTSRRYRRAGDPHDSAHTLLRTPFR
jgi:hypothetical protein